MEGAPRNTYSMPKILTTLIKDKVSTWGECTELLPGWREEVDRTWRKRKKAPLLSDIVWGWRFFRASHRYDVVLTGFQRCAIVFALMQRLLRRSRVAHIYIDTHLGYTLPADPLRRRIRRFILVQLLRSASRAVVFSERQCELYVQEFAAAADRFVAIPYYSTLFGQKYPVVEGDYIFAGGDYTRDYATFIEAIRPLPYRIVIAAFYRHYFQGIRIPPNVEIVTTTHEGFLRLMAEAGAVVVPLKGGLLRAGGEQTYLNAMALGKAVVVTDDTGADEYIENGVSGMVLKPGNPEALRFAITTLMENPALARTMGQKAKTVALKFSPDRFVARVLALAEECINDSRKS